MLRSRISSSATECPVSTVRYTASIFRPACIRRRTRRPALTFRRLSRTHRTGAAGRWPGAPFKRADATSGRRRSTRKATSRRQHKHSRGRLLRHGRSSQHRGRLVAAAAATARAWVPGRTRTRRGSSIIASARRRRSSVATAARRRSMNPPGWRARSPCPWSRACRGRRCRG